MSYIDSNDNNVIFKNFFQFSAHSLGVDGDNVDRYRPQALLCGSGRNLPIILFACAGCKDLDFMIECSNFLAVDFGVHIVADEDASLVRILTSTADHNGYARLVDDGDELLTHRKLFETFNLQHPMNELPRHGPAIRQTLRLGCGQISETHFLTADSG